MGAAKKKPRPTVGQLSAEMNAKNRAAADRVLALSPAQNRKLQAVARKAVRKASAAEPKPIGQVKRASGVEQRRVTVYLPTIIADELFDLVHTQRRKLSEVAAELLASALGLKL